MTRWRPCGACRELVPADTGCGHWAPGLTVKAASSKARRGLERDEVARQRAEIESFRRMMTRRVTG